MYRNLMQFWSLISSEIIDLDGREVFYKQRKFLPIIVLMSSRNSIYCSWEGLGKMLVIVFPFYSDRSTLCRHLYRKDNLIWSITESRLLSVIEGIIPNFGKSNFFANWNAFNSFWIRMCPIFQPLAFRQNNENPTWR